MVVVTPLKEGREGKGASSSSATALRRLKRNEEDSLEKRTVDDVGVTSDLGSRKSRANELNVFEKRGGKGRR